MEKISPMAKLDYYGFSLLAYVQKEFNSKFKLAGNFFEGCIGEGPVDFSVLVGPSKDLDLATQIFDGKLRSSEITAIGDAAMAVGGKMVETLWSLSQWIPDRKRSALVMTNPKSLRRDRKWLATCISPIVNENDAESFLIEVKNNDCAELCLKFMKLVRERHLVQK